MQKRDTPIIGFLIGLGTLLAGLTIVYLLLYQVGQGISITDFVSLISYVPDQASKVLSLALIAEIIPITWVKRRKLDGTARGLFVAIMLAALAILWLKFIA
jgi:amino acid permease